MPIALLHWFSVLLALLPLPPKVAPADPAVLPAAMWAVRSLVYVRHQPNDKVEKAGALRIGGQVQVNSVARDADGNHPWALINGGGAVPLAALKPLNERPNRAKVQAAEATFVYGRVITADAAEYAAPDLHSAERGHQRAARLLAFVPDAPLQAKGWLWRAAGGYMRTSDLKMLTPSLFAGEHNPTLPLAIVRRKTQLQTAEGRKLPLWVSRYDRLPVLHERGAMVEVKDGFLPHQRVRIAYAPQRPAQIPAHARWMHVDLGEQVLVAMEGATPVLATLMSSGRSPHQTTKGVFRIYAKTVHSTMRGPGPTGYRAEGVPWVMHFFRGEALHGAYWHDQFGVVKSHGCLNLAPADAKWLFEWVPPELPKGWYTLLAGSTDPAVYIAIDLGRSGSAPLRSDAPN